MSASSEYSSHSSACEHFPPTPCESEVDTFEFEYFPPTPCESEVDTFEWYRDVALRVYIGRCTGQMGKKKCMYWLYMLGTCPRAMEFFQALLLEHPLRDVEVMRYGAFLAGKATREFNEKNKKGKAYHGS